MPIYEYRCGSCDHQFEALQKVNEEALHDCPQCREPALRKLISAVAFRLKGSGWYETDFKSGNKRNVADSGDGETKSDGGAEKDGDAKTDGGAKTETAKDAAKAPKDEKKPSKPDSTATSTS